MKRMSLLATAALLAAAPLSAQDINGTWFTEFERSIRNNDGQVSAGEKTKAKITLQQKGDSVFGTFELVPAAGQPTPPARPLRGSVKGGKGTLVSEFEGRRNINGEESVVKMTVVYDFSIAADKLEGTTMTKTSDMDMPPRPFSAWREKSGS
jgi:hypothetical protein